METYRFITSAIFHEFRHSRMLLAGIQGAGTGPPIKTFGGDVLGVAIPSLHGQFSFVSVGVME
jgi:hypothetical protein